MPERESLRKTIIKNGISSKTDENKSKVDESLKLAYSRIDKATKRNVFHKNKAARKKSQLANCLKMI